MPCVLLLGWCPLNGKAGGLYSCDDMICFCGIFQRALFVFFKMWAEMWSRVGNEGSHHVPGKIRRNIKKGRYSLVRC